MLRTTRSLWEVWSSHVYRCAWLMMTDKTIPDAGWYYAQPYDAAKNIKDHVAFCGLS